MESIQKTSWGSILWLNTQDSADDNIMHGMHLGIVTVNAGAHQAKHIHFDEQALYVTQGQAVSIVDGKETSLSAGSFQHMKKGIKHEVYNIGNVPFQHLLISNPEEDAEDNEMQKSKRHTDRQITPDIIYTAVAAVRTQFLDTLQYAYAIFDHVGNLIVQSDYFPEYCVRHCSAPINKGACPCMRKEGFTAWKEKTVLDCPYGMEVFLYPIYLDGIFLGYIESGFVRYSGSVVTNHKKFENTDGVNNTQQDAETCADINSVYEVPDSVVYGIRALTSRIIKAICNYCEFEMFRQDMEDKELKLASNEKTQEILLKNLRDTQYAVTDLKINNHFLFNTLNSMASMALDGGMMNLYQPIVENAFIHGFKEMPRKRLRIEASMEDGDLYIWVKNSGGNLTEQECNVINQSIDNNTSHGLSMILQKLRLGCSKDSTLFIGRDGKNTCVSVIIKEIRKAEQGT